MSTPARRQYLQMKSQYPDAILMYQIGDFYETFDEDARTTAHELQIVLTARHYGSEKVLLAGIPLHALDNYVGKLVQRGYKVAICEQVGEVGHGIVERAVTRILTAGTLSEPNLLPTRQSNYLVAIASARTQTGLAAVDVSTGEFIVTWFEPQELPTALASELQRLTPVECLLVEGSSTNTFQLPSQNMTITYCPLHFFEYETAQARLYRIFGVQSLAAYGCAEQSQAIIAAGAIVAYLEKMNRSLLSLFMGLRSYRTSSYMILDAHTQRNLDLLQGARSNSVHGSLLGVLDRTLTPMGARHLRRIVTQPLLDLNQIEARLQAVNELYDSPSLRSRFALCLQGLGDLQRIAGRVRQGSVVPRDVLALREYLRTVPTLHELLRSCTASLLRELADELDPCPQAVDAIEQALADTDGTADEERGSGRLIRAGFHAELDSLIASISDSRRWMVSLEAHERARTGIKSLKVGFNKVFGYYIEVSHANVKLVLPDYIRKQTLVNAERFITPELKEHEARILSAEERIQEMEQSIYADLLRQLGTFYPQLIATATAIASIDVLLSLAEVAVRQAYVRPVLEVGQALEIVNGRHPVVKYTLDGDIFIPNDTLLDAASEANGTGIILLTGPNMAGKSTYLRQVALITLLAQIGSFVPAESARIGLVDRIFTRVGAEDDIASGKSTFMVEMEETAIILHHATQHSLVILDEIGRGTSTYDGLAIARAVIEHLHNVTKARTLFATHYHELAAMEHELSHLHVYTMAIRDDEPGKIVFLHRVLPGATGRSYGVHVARLAGMPPHVVQRAQEVLERLEAGHHSVAATSCATTQAWASILPGNASREYQENGLDHPETIHAVTYDVVPNTPDVPNIPDGINNTQYTWQSEEAQIAAQGFMQANTVQPDLNMIDLCAITPLDALNLLFVMQRKKRKDISYSH